MGLKDTLNKWLNIDPSLGYNDERMYNPGTVGWTPLSSTLHHYNNYENAFASIRVLATRFAKIEPYTIDKKGNSVPSNVLDRLYTPNTAMSAYDFREALAVMSLVHNKTYIRVTFNSERRSADDITGFVFLEGVNEHIIDGKKEYWLPNGTKLSTDDVIELKSINPYDLNAGYSHAYAARRWTTLDDYMADYQAGFFQNGAVPSGQFVITAKTPREFTDIATRLKRSHQGAGKNNNVMYVHRPTDAGGKPVDSQVQWIPFSTDNKNLGLKDLFEQANKKIDSVYGVPASLRGVNDQNTYASVRLDTQIFYENTLEPFTLKVWDKFNHELNRITGGLGVAITFEIETPVVADEEKARAEAVETTSRTVLLLSDRFELASVANYLRSGDINDLVEKPVPVERPDITDPDDLDETPDQPVDLTRSAKKKDSPDTLDNHLSKALDPKLVKSYEKQLYFVIKNRMTKQVEQAEILAEKKKAPTLDKPIDEQEDILLAEEMMTVLIPFMIAQGVVDREYQLTLLAGLGIDASDLEPFTLTTAQREAYRRYVDGIATGYNAQTAEKIRNVITTAREQGLSASEIKQQLRGTIEDWRIDRLSRTEIQLAGNQALHADIKQIKKELGIVARKRWITRSGQPCEFCRSLEDRGWVDFEETYVAKDDALVGADGGTMVNTWRTVDEACLHANCECEEEIVWERQ